MMEGLYTPSMRSVLNNGQLCTFTRLALRLEQTCQVEKMDQLR